MEVLLAALLFTDAEISKEEEDDDDDGPGPVENNHGVICVCEAHEKADSCVLVQVRSQGRS